MLTSDLLKLLLVFDFDKTISTADTTDLIANGIINSFPETLAERTALWADINTAYEADYANFTLSNPLTSSNTTDLTTLHSEYATYLAATRKIELASIARTNASGVFANITTAQLTAIGRNAYNNNNVTLRHGFSSFFNQVRALGVPAKILTVSWSSSFISGVLDAAGVNTTGLEITGNDIDETGAIVGGVYTAEDKLREINAMTTTKCGKAKYDDVVYFGDSETDLLALAAVRGVVVGFENATTSTKTKLARYEGINITDIIQIADASTTQKAMELNDYDDATSYFLDN